MRNAITWLMAICKAIIPSPLAKQTEFSTERLNIMARIRTIKPELFRHEILFDLEKETGLPMRVAWMGLFTVCDRKGRFKWRPKSLKLEILPWDDVDFSRVLHALVTRGMIVKYAKKTDDEAIYGAIPTFENHQVINNKESPSLLPDPAHPDCVLIDISHAFVTREPRVVDACGTRLNPDQGEGKGREGKGKEGNDNCGLDEPAPQVSVLADFDFESVYEEYPKRNGDQGKKKGLEICVKRIKTQERFAEFKRSVSNYSKSIQAKGQTGTEFVKQFKTFAADWDEWICPDIPSMNGIHPKTQARQNAYEEYLRLSQTDQNTDDGGTEVVSE